MADEHRCYKEAIIKEIGDKTSNQETSIQVLTQTVNQISDTLSRMAGQNDDIYNSLYKNGLSGQIAMNTEFRLKFGKLLEDVKRNTEFREKQTREKDSWKWIIRTAMVTQSLAFVLGLILHFSGKL
jgi:hypothetical protein